MTNKDGLEDIVVRIDLEHQGQRLVESRECLLHLARHMMRMTPKRGDFFSISSLCSLFLFPLSISFLFPLSVSSTQAEKRIYLPGPFCICTCTYSERSVTASIKWICCVHNLSNITGLRTPGCYHSHPECFLSVISPCCLQ